MLSCLVSAPGVMMSRKGLSHEEETAYEMVTPTRSPRAPRHFRQVPRPWPLQQRIAVAETPRAVGG
jgi:hypothetical protein